MRQTPVITDFTAGELSDKLSGRFDLAVYSKGASILENFLPLSQGGVTYRPGTAYLGTAKALTATRLIPFIISSDVAFVLELGLSYMRFWKDGSLLKTGNNPIEQSTPWTTASMVKELQVAQVYSSLYLVHQGAAPMVLTWNGGTSFTIATLSVTGITGDIPFQSALNYPGAVAAFGGRLYFAGTTNEPGKVWASKPFAYDDFTYYDTVETTEHVLTDPTTWDKPSVAEYETITLSRKVTGAGHAFTLELASDQNDRILWMAAGRQLVIGTMSGEWVLPPDISATAISAQLQTRYGSAAIQGRLVGPAVLFVQASGARLREYIYQNELDAYQSPDLTFLADHVLAEGVVDLDYMNLPEPLVLATLENGTLAVLLYNRQAGTVAWARMLFDGGLVESVATVPYAGGNDEAWLVVRRGSTLCIERWRPYSDDPHVDSFVEETHNIGAQTTGFGRFTGKTISADGLAATVSNGSLVWPGGLTETAPEDWADPEVPEYETSSATYTVGLPIAACLRTMRLSTQAAEGTGQTKLKRINAVTFRLLDSTAFSVGYADDTGSLETIRLEESPFTGDARVGFRGRWDRDGWVTVHHESLGDLTILALSPEVDS